MSFHVDVRKPGLDEPGKSLRLVEPRALRPERVPADVRPRQPVRVDEPDPASTRSAEHTSELLSLLRISYAVFCLKKHTHTRTTRISNDIHCVTRLILPSALTTNTHKP